MERDLKIIFLLLGVILFVEYALVYWYPQYQFQTHLEKISGLKREELQRSSDFQFSNAREYLQQLTSFGARITGSDITEHKIPEWVMQTVKTIQTEHRNSEMNIQWDIQHPSSHFPLDFLGGMHNIYNNVTNVIVRITWPQHLLSEQSNGILINAHYDSIPSSPGAADDGIGIAVMLEMIRALSHGKPLQYPLLLLFNGAEEWNHQAAHGFISQHPWAQQVKYLINLEATGSGGRELVFQCNSGELAAIYSQAVPFPQASVMAHELFKSFLYKVASTDWRTLLRYGPKGMKGLDTAYVDNGYVYHTALDAAEIVPDATLHNTGENILHLTRALGDAQIVQAYSSSSTDTAEDTSAVFYDFFFLRMIVYWGSSVYLVHGLMLLFGLTTILYLMQQSRGRITASLLRLAILDELLAQGIAIACLALYGLFAHFVLPMRWYHGGLFVTLIEFFPVTFLAIFWGRYWTHSKKKQQQSQQTNPVLRQLAALSLWVAAGSLCFVLGIMSGFIPCLWVLTSSTAILVYWHRLKAQALSSSLFLEEDLDRSKREEKRKVHSSREEEMIVFCLREWSSSSSDENEGGDNDENHHPRNSPMKKSSVTSLLEKSPRNKLKSLNNNSSSIYNNDGKTGSSSYYLSAPFLYLLVLSPKLLLTARYFDATFTMLIPLFGKTGSTLPSDLAMAVTVAVFLVSASGTLFANINFRSLASHRSLLQTMRYLILITWIYLYLSSVAYSVQHPKRLWLQHVQREYRNIPVNERPLYLSPLSVATAPRQEQEGREAKKEKAGGEGVLTDYGLWVIAFDSQGFAPIDSSIQGYLRKVSTASPTSSNSGKEAPYYQRVSCEVAQGGCYAQFPWYFPVAEALQDSYYLPTKTRPQIDPSQSFQLLVSSHPLPSPSERGRRRLLEIIFAGPSHMHLVLRNAPIATSFSSSLSIQERITRWYLNDSLSSSSPSSFQQSLLRYEQAKPQKPSYSSAEIAQMERRLEDKTLSSMRWDGIYYFEMGFGACPQHYCIKRLYLEILGQEAVDVIGYGHYVEQAKIRTSRSTKEKEAAEDRDAIDEFVDLLPDWSKGAEWTKFPSALIVERI